MYFNSFVFFPSKHVVNNTINDLSSSSLVRLLSQYLKTAHLSLGSLLLLLDTLLQLVLYAVTLLDHLEVLLSLLLLVGRTSSLQLELEFMTTFNSLATTFLQIH